MRSVVLIAAVLLALPAAAASDLPFGPECIDRFCIPTILCHNQIVLDGRCLDEIADDTGSAVRCIILTECDESERPVGAIAPECVPDDLACIDEWNLWLQGAGPCGRASCDMVGGLLVHLINGEAQPLP